MEYQTIFLGLGSNLGNREEFLSQARQSLKDMPLKEFKSSSIYESHPYQGMQQPLYYNQVVMGKTGLSPQTLMLRCLQIEKHLGRVRRQHWSSRVIDIDILFYGNVVLSSEQLIIPHKDFMNRSFVLMPLLELSPNWIDPLSGKTISMLFDEWSCSHDESSIPKRVLANESSLTL